MLLIPLLLLLFKPRFTGTGGYWAMVFAYVLAKIFEFFDGSVFNSLDIISGHSLKHIAAALGVLFLLRTYKTRERT
jgi:hypothetical protein